MLRIHKVLALNLSLEMGYPERFLYSPLKCFMKVLRNYFQNVYELHFRNVLQFTMRKCKPLLVFVGAFAELRKAAFNFVMSVCIELLGSHWMDFREISYLIVFRKSVETVQV